jgi:Lipase (class 3)
MLTPWPQVRVLLGEVDEAMALLNLEKRHLFFDRDRETKVVVAWNWHKILVVIRGSYARANFVEDAKVCENFCLCCCLCTNLLLLWQQLLLLCTCSHAASLHSVYWPAEHDAVRGALVVLGLLFPVRIDRSALAVAGETRSADAPRRARVQFLQTAHPPKRRFGGRTPRVHRGFLATWQANGVRDRVLAYIETLLASHPDRGQVKVMCTGHSLGGAVATLAAADIARRCDISKTNIMCYTFGCPRVGAQRACARARDFATPAAALLRTTHGRGGNCPPAAHIRAARGDNMTNCWREPCAQASPRPEG